jgi:hypothetical protein
MADAAPAVQGPGRPGNQQNGQQQQGGGNQFFATIARMVLMWWVMSYFKGNQQQATSTPAGAAAPLYRKGDMLDVYVFVSEQSLLHRDTADLVWAQTEVGLATTPELTATYTYTPSEVNSYCLLCDTAAMRALHVLISRALAYCCRL